jgi:hypothetical protein
LNLSLLWDVPIHEFSHTQVSHVSVSVAGKRLVYKAPKDDCFGPRWIAQWGYSPYPIFFILI